MSDFITVTLPEQCSKHSGTDSDEQRLIPLLRAHRRVRHVSGDSRLVGRSPVASAAGRRLRSIDATEAHSARTLWDQGLRGAGVRVAIFDSGLSGSPPHLAQVAERTNWTDEDTVDDEIGHGTFVAGVIGSSAPECPGFAPEAELFIFRVFTSAQLSYSSWFLDAFNYAIQSDIDVLNLSIGGPDFLDMPFVDKVNEMSAHGIVVVSAIGNDGPLYGTLNNPGDQLDVIGVGGVDSNNELADFSSRGMTTWELPGGYGRPKPDIVAVADSVQGAGIRGGCRQLSGTSVASPVVTGAVALLLSLEPDRDKRRARLSPAAIKQALLESAVRLAGPSIFEQGQGLLNLPGALTLLRAYSPRASAFPAALDLTDCPFMGDLCAQPLFADSLGLTLNVTLLNGMDVYGELSGEPRWVPGLGADALQLRFTHSAALWPWTGWLGVELSVRAAAELPPESLAEGVIALSVVSSRGAAAVTVTDIEIPLRVRLVPTPPRSRRLLWSIFHNVRYPAGFAPRDSLPTSKEVLDWHGDHPHTNLRGLFAALVAAGWSIDIHGEPLACIDLTRYSTVLLTDSEDEFFAAEVAAVSAAVRSQGLSLLVAADWYSTESMRALKFFDENTRMTWVPLTGGANVPALNDLLAEHGVAFGSGVWRGPVDLGTAAFSVLSGAQITRFPAGGRLLRVPLSLENRPNGEPATQSPKRPVAILGVVPAQRQGGGRVAVFGDSSCADTAFGTDCEWLLVALAEYCRSGELHSALESALAPPLAAPMDETGGAVPLREVDSDLPFFSRVIGRALACSPHSLTETQHTHAYTLNDALAADAHYKEVWAALRSRRGEPGATGAGGGPIGLPRGSGLGRRGSGSGGLFGVPVAAAPSSEGFGRLLVMVLCGLAVSGCAWSLFGWARWSQRDDRSE